MSGVRLEDMEAADMTDVLHFFFEEDTTYVSQEQADSRSQARESIYREFYNWKYPYVVRTGTASGQSFAKDFDADEALFEEDEITPFDPMQKQVPTKPFIAPTHVEASHAKPFGDVLDAPFEH